MKLESEFSVRRSPTDSMESDSFNQNDSIFYQLTQFNSRGGKSTFFYYICRREQRIITNLAAFKKFCHKNTIKI